MINLSLQDTKTIIVIVAIILGLLVSLLIFFIAKTYRTSNVKVYEMINNQIKEKRPGILQYTKIEAFLKKYGADYHIPILAEPLKFITASFFLCCLGLVMGSMIHPALCLIFGIIGLLCPMLLVTSSGKKENTEILQDIKTIYNSLTSQIKSGIYISTAITECASATIIKNKRLLLEMQRLAANIKLTSDIAQSITEFVSHFNNMYITSLGIILTQALESGQAMEALSDISDQLKDVEKNIFTMKREKKQIRNLAFELMFLAVILTCAAVFIFPILIKDLNASGF